MEVVTRTRALCFCTVLIFLSEVHSELIHLPSSLLHGVQGKPLLLPAEARFPLEELEFEGTWYHTPVSGHSTHLVIFSNTGVIPSLRMKSRLSLQLPSASLLLLRLEAGDEGEYSLSLDISVKNRTLKTERRMLRVTVDVPVSGPVVVRTPSSPVVEDRDNVTWSCSASNGTNVHYGWQRDGVPLVPGDRHRFSEDKSTLVISPVREEDRGRYRCLVWNHVSRTSSPALELSVLYGPYNLSVLCPQYMPSQGSEGLRNRGVFTVNPGEVTFHCQAASNPPSSCEWVFLGSNSTQAGPRLKVSYYRPQHVEDFLLRAFNNVTQRQAEIPFTLLVTGMEIGNMKHSQESSTTSPMAVAVLVCSLSIIIACMLMVFLRRTCHPKRVLMNIYKRPLTEQKRPHSSGHEDATEDFGIYEFVSLPGNMESTLASSRSLAHLESVPDLHTTIYDVIRHIPDGMPTQSLLE
ncbi:HEPACAM family member 2 [Osmerus mordax]|uniref:HEPACAM family member 2 n=1 Tax=Osmerus mordax TaxID=8014 RepID=UPI003510A877